jgi:hypothetical protein
MLGKLPTTSHLPRRKETYVEIPKTNPDFYIDSIDNLIETTLQYVLAPLSQATYFFVEIEDEFEGEQPNITL